MPKRILKPTLVLTHGVALPNDGVALSEGGEGGVCSTLKWRHIWDNTIKGLREVLTKYDIKCT